MIRRRHILRVFVPAMTAAALVAPGASAMPTQEVGSSAANSPALVDAAAHAATVRAIGAKLVARACE